jgi:hypothetical protein
MDKELPKLLVIGINAWRDEGSIHTLIDIFSHWHKNRLAHIYTRADLPHTVVCDRFFQIAENSVLHSVWNRKKITGRQVENCIDFDEESSNAIAEERARYAKARKKHSWLMSCCREMVWFLGKWKTRELDLFIEEFDPDVLFIPIYPTVFMGWLQNYIIKKTGKPAVCYLADDNYTYKACGHNPLAYIHRFFLRGQVKKLVAACGGMFVIVDKQKEEYDKIFGVNSRLLTKGIDYSQLNFEPKIVRLPLRMVYTGKLIIGREKSLAAISLALEEINRGKIKITLDIYSPDVVDSQIMKLLNSNGVVHRGSVPLHEVAGIQAKADVVVFVESLEAEFRQVARLSFSTKLTDYFRSGKCIFAIGDKTIAPIDYLKRNDAAIIVSEYHEILPKLKLLVDNPELVAEYSRKGFDCGKRNHDVKIVRHNLISTICEVCESHPKK